MDDNLSSMDDVVREEREYVPTSIRRGTMVGGGVLLLLVPAAESAVVIARRHLQWLIYRRKNGYEVRNARTAV